MHVPFLVEVVGDGFLLDFFNHFSSIHFEDQTVEDSELEQNYSLHFQFDLGV